MELGISERFYLELLRLIDRTKHCADTQCIDCFALCWAIHVKKRRTQKLNTGTQGGLGLIIVPNHTSNVQPLFLEINGLIRSTEKL
jgi:P2-related tail formation protein